MDTFLSNPHLITHTKRLSPNSSRLMLAPRRFLARGLVLVYPADEGARGEEGEGGLE
jgi:hypothetical protein